MRSVLVGRARVELDASRIIGTGGEADVYDVGGGNALKVFRDPSDPSFRGIPGAADAARRRLADHQEKLPELMTRRVPDRVVRPVELARYRGAVVGYTMRLVAGAESLYQIGEPRARKRESGDRHAAVLRDLHRTLSALHAGGVQVGDFNDLNVLVAGTNAWMIDADSYQFGRWVCRMFSERFVDPRLCDPAKGMTPTRPHDRDSDWFAFAAMALRTLLGVGPYGGVHRPRDASGRVPAGRRPLAGISVYSPDVVYPRPAIHYRALPDDLNERFRAVFDRGERGEFPARLLAIRWTSCAACGSRHARSTCPDCTPAARVAPAVKVAVRGTVHATVVFRTGAGALMDAAVQDGVRWAHAEPSATGYELVSGGTRLGPVDPASDVVTCAGPGAVVVRPGDGAVRAVVLRPGHPERHVVGEGRARFAPMAHDGRRLFWVAGGALMRDGPHGPVLVGSVPRGITSVWVDNGVGIAFYRVGARGRVCVFDPDHAGIDDSVTIPVAGAVLTLAAVAAPSRAWLAWTAARAGRVVNHLAAVDLAEPAGARSVGRPTLAAVQDDGAGAWIGAAGRGCAVGRALFVPTDDGLVRVETAPGGLVVTREFPDTRQFVHAGNRLLAAPDGIYVVGTRTITRLQMRA